jgi:hypothetical protein
MPKCGQMQDWHVHGQPTGRSCVLFLGWVSSRLPGGETTPDRYDMAAAPWLDNIHGRITMVLFAVIRTL